MVSTSLPYFAMKACVKLTAALLLSILSVSCQEEETDVQKRSVVSLQCITGDVDEITINSATLKGVAVIGGTPSAPATAEFYISSASSDVPTILSHGTKVPAGVLSEGGGFFQAVASGLAPATLYYYVASVTADGKTATGSVSSFTTLTRPAEIIVTAEATNITKNSAILYGYADLEQTGVSNVQFGIIVSTKENPSESNGRLWRCYEVDRNNKYFAEVDGLKSGTTYYYKAYIKIGDLLKVGEIKQFTTESYNVSVTTHDASDIGAVYGTLNGRLQVDDTGELSKKVWFLFSSSASSVEHLRENGNRIDAYLGQDGYFSHAVGLSSGTQYYYVACAHVADGDFYGDVKSFTTQEIQTSVTTGTATDVSIASATINGTLNNGSGLPASVSFLYSETASTLERLKASGTEISSTLKSDGTSFSSTLTGLNSGTKYYYTTVATVGDKYFYGEVNSFTTQAINATVSTLAAIDIALFTATLRGSIQVDNTENLEKSVFLYYSTSARTLDELKASGTRVTTASISYDGIFVYVLTGLPSSTKFYYVACANVAGKIFYGDVVSFSTRKETDYGEAVDLGLSVKWRTCNIGATSPEDYGSYYAWGETGTKYNYSWATYQWCNGSSTTLTKYNTSNSYGVQDNRTVLEKDDDVAFVKLGGKWRMPTDAEWTELREQCTWTWTSQNGVTGRLVTSKTNGNSIFLPAAGYRYDTSLYNVGSNGYYWSSSLNTDNPYYAWNVYFYSSNVYRYINNRFNGFSVRPITE